MAIIKGTFKSEWDFGDRIIETLAILDTESGELTVDQTDENIEDVTTLDSETFTSEDGTEYEVCPDCHEFVLKTEIREAVGKHLYETKVCNGCGYNS